MQYVNFSYPINTDKKNGIGDVPSEGGDSGSRSDRTVNMIFLRVVKLNSIYIHPHGAQNESSLVWDTFCLAELIYDLISRQFLFGKCPKSVTIQLSLTVLYILTSFVFGTL